MLSVSFFLIVIDQSGKVSLCSFPHHKHGRFRAVLVHIRYSGYVGQQRSHALRVLLYFCRFHGNPFYMTLG